MIKFMGQYGRPNLALAGILVKISPAKILHNLQKSQSEAIMKLQQSTKLQTILHLTTAFLVATI